MELIKETEIEKAAQVLKEGGVLVFPTETVYGIGTVYDNPDSYHALMLAKRRPSDKPFTLMCSSVKEALGFLEAPKLVQKTLEQFLPGELTVLVKAKREVTPEWVDFGTGVIGIRVPASNFVSRLIRSVGKPCLVTSANISSYPPAKTFEEAKAYFSEVADGIVDGLCLSMIPSTIVDLTGDEPKLVREGPLPFPVIENFWRKNK